MITFGLMAAPLLATACETPGPQAEGGTPRGWVPADKLNATRNAPDIFFNWGIRSISPSAGAQTLHTTIQDLFNGKLTPELAVLIAYLFARRTLTSGLMGVGGK